MSTKKPAEPKANLETSKDALSAKVEYAKVYQDFTAKGSFTLSGKEYKPGDKISLHNKEGIEYMKSKNLI